MKTRIIYHRGLYYPEHRFCFFWLQILNDWVHCPEFGYDTLACVGRKTIEEALEDLRVHKEDRVSNVKKVVWSSNE